MSEKLKGHRTILSAWFVWFEILTCIRYDTILSQKWILQGYAKTSFSWSRWSFSKMVPFWHLDNEIE